MQTHIYVEIGIEFGLCQFKTKCKLKKIVFLKFIKALPGDDLFCVSVTQV